MADEIFKLILLKQYGITDTSIKRVQGGWAADAYMVSTKARRYFLKVYERSRASTQKWTALIDVYAPIVGYLADTKLKGRISNPIMTVYNEYRCEDEHNIYMLYEHIDGVTIGERELSDSQVSQLGEIIAILHSFNQSNLNFPTDRIVEDYALPFCHYLMDTLEHIDDLDNDVRLVLAPYADRLRQLCESTISLSLKLGENNKSMVLCHADIHNFNLMEVKGRVVLIDWEGLKLAPPEQDMMFMVDTEYWDRFYKVYRGLHKGYTIDRHALSFYRGRRKLEDVWEWIQQLIYDKQDEEKRQETILSLKKELTSM